MPFAVGGASDHAAAFEPKIVTGTRNAGQVQLRVLLACSLAVECALDHASAPDTEIDPINRVVGLALQRLPIACISL